MFVYVCVYVCASARVYVYVRMCITRYVWVCARARACARACVCVPSYNDLKCMHKLKYYLLID